MHARAITSAITLLLFAACSSGCAVDRPQPSHTPMVSDRDFSVVYIEDVFLPKWEGSGWGATALVPTGAWAYDVYELDLDVGTVVALRSGEEIEVDESPESSSAQRVAALLKGPVTLEQAIEGDDGLLGATRVVELDSAGTSETIPPWRYRPSPRGTGKPGAPFWNEGLLDGPVAIGNASEVWVSKSDNVEQYFVADESTSLLDRVSGTSGAFIGNFQPSSTAVVRIQLHVIEGIPYAREVQLLAR